MEEETIITEEEKVEANIEDIKVDEAKTEEKKSKSIAGIIAWIFGVIVIILGGMYIIEDFWYALFMVLLGVLCFPITREKIGKFVKDPYRLPLIIILAFVFIVGVFLTA